MSNTHYLEQAFTFYVGVDVLVYIFVSLAFEFMYGCILKNSTLVIMVLFSLVNIEIISRLSVYTQYKLCTFNKDKDFE